VGLTKERVRQIQNSALAKIRAALEGGHAGEGHAQLSGAN
jgi:DNA-directed RNA polymerase sigma subunit (sigma70/sigma32)